MFSWLLNYIDLFPPLFLRLQQEAGPLKPGMHPGLHLKPEIEQIQVHAAAQS